jgi:hypothetical protein
LAWHYSAIEHHSIETDWGARIARTQNQNGATALKNASRTSGLHLLNLNSGRIRKRAAKPVIAASVGAAWSRSRNAARAAVKTGLDPLVDWRRRIRRQKTSVRPFLGFSHIWGKSRAGKNVVRQLKRPNADSQPSVGG